MAFRSPSRTSEPPFTRRGALDKRADRGMRAYVTSGELVHDARSAMRVRYGLTPRRVLTSSMARHTSGARPSRSTHRLQAAISGWGSGDGGRCLRSLQASPPKVPTLRAAGRRDGPCRFDVGARLRDRSRERTPRQSRHPEVAPDVSIRRQAPNRYAASDASRVHDRGNMTTLLGLS